MPLAEELNSLLPDGWRVTHIIDLEPGWQVSLFDGEWIVVANDDSIETALNAAIIKTYDETAYTGRWAGLAALRAIEPPRDNSLLSRLGLLRAQAPIKRRI